MGTVSPNLSRVKVRLEIEFETPTEEDLAAHGSVARHLASDPQSVRVIPRDDNPHWLWTGQFDSRSGTGWTRLSRFPKTRWLPASLRGGKFRCSPFDAWIGAALAPDLS